MAWICSCGQRNTLSGLPCLACDRLPVEAEVQTVAPAKVTRPISGSRFREDPDNEIIEELAPVVDEVEPVVDEVTEPAAIDWPIAPQPDVVNEPPVAPLSVDRPAVSDAPAVFEVEPELGAADEVPFATSPVEDEPVTEPVTEAVEEPQPIVESPPVNAPRADPVTPVPGESVINDDVAIKSFDHDWSSWRKGVAKPPAEPDEVKERPDPWVSTWATPPAYDEREIVLDPPAHSPEPSAPTGPSSEPAEEPVEAVVDHDPDPSSVGSLAEQPDDGATKPHSSPADEFDAAAATDNRDLVIPRRPLIRDEAARPASVMSVRAVAGLNDPNRPNWAQGAEPSPPTIVEAGQTRVKVPALQDLFASGADLETPDDYELPANEWSPGRTPPPRTPQKRRPAPPTAAKSSPAESLSAFIQDHRRWVILVSLVLSIVLISSLWGGLLREVFAASSDPEVRALQSCQASEETYEGTDPAPLMAFLPEATSTVAVIPEHQGGGGAVSGATADVRFRAGYYRQYSGEYSWAVAQVSQFASADCAELAFSRAAGAEQNSNVLPIDGFTTTVNELNGVNTWRGYLVKDGRLAELTWVDARPSVEVTPDVLAFFQRQKALL